MKTENNAAHRQSLFEREALSLSCAFVPFSQSRNAANKHRSLNWRVTLRCKDRDILTTDYSQGVGHCPANKRPPRASSGLIDTHAQKQLMEYQSETGRTGKRLSGSGFVVPTKDMIPPPTLEEVIYSLLMDAEVLDYNCFEEWAESLGVDKDSRKGEKIYQTCLSIALSLRNALGDSVVSELRDAYQDY